VTGVDFLDPKVFKLPTRRTLLVHSQDVQQPQEGILTIGDARAFEIALYDSVGKPRWLQEPNEREHPDLNACGIRIPKFFDIVRIPVEIDPLVLDVIKFEKQDIYQNLWDAGNDVVVAGYPYGYSAMDEKSPEPIFLKRSIASNRIKTGPVILDGGATPGMSGAPAILRDQGRWWLCGMYAGIVFPDFTPASNDQANDRFAALGLMVPIHLSRAFMQVPGLFDR
jgi:hypothetical protein